MKYKWIPVNLNAPFAPRDGAGLLSFKGKLWLLGGWNPKDKVNFPSICNSEVWSSEDGLNWTLEIKEAPWEGRHTAGYVVHDQKMWIVGGDCIQGATSRMCGARKTARTGSSSRITFRGGKSAASYRGFQRENMGHGRTNRPRIRTFRTENDIL